MEQPQKFHKYSSFFCLFHFQHFQCKYDAFGTFSWSNQITFIKSVLAQTMGVLRLFFDQRPHEGLLGTCSKCSSFIFSVFKKKMNKNSTINIKKQIFVKSL